MVERVGRIIYQQSAVYTRLTARAHASPAGSSCSFANVTVAEGGGGTLRRRGTEVKYLHLFISFAGITLDRYILYLIIPDVKSLTT